MYLFVYMMTLNTDFRILYLREVVLPIFKLSLNNTYAFKGYF